MKETQKHIVNETMRLSRGEPIALRIAFSKFFQKNLNKSNCYTQTCNSEIESKQESKLESIPIGLEWYLSTLNYIDDNSNCIFNDINKTPDELNIFNYPKEHLSNSLWIYINELKKYREFSDDEIFELFKRYRSGDLKAYDLIVKSNLRFVVFFAFSFFTKDCPLEDLIQEGNIGLLKAIDRFDPFRIRSFKLYALAWIIQSISFYINKFQLIVKLPNKLLFLHRKLHRYYDNYEQKFGHLPFINDVSIIEDKDDEKTDFLLQLPRNLKELVVQKDSLDDFESFLPATDEFQENEYRHYFINTLLGQINKINELIIRMYFGIDTPKKNLSTIGEQFELSRERVRQIVVNTIDEMRELSNKKPYGVLPAERIDKFLSKYPDEEGCLMEQSMSFYRQEFKYEEQRSNNSSLNISSSFVPLKDSLLSFTTATSVHSVNKKHVVDKSISQKPETWKNKEFRQILYKLDDIKVGDNIIYKGQNCTIEKIIVMDKSSNLIIKYDNGVLDVISNDKSKYVKIT